MTHGGDWNKEYEEKSLEHMKKELARMKTMMQKPSLGRIVHYVLTNEDAVAIERRRTTHLSVLMMMEDKKWPEGAQAHVGNPVQEGLHVVMVIVAVWPGEFGSEGDGVNGQCLLDGNDSLWVTSVKHSSANEPGTWHWPEPV